MKTAKTSNQKFFFIVMCFALSIAKSISAGITDTIIDKNINAIVVPDSASISLPKTSYKKIIIPKVSYEITGGDHSTSILGAGIEHSLNRKFSYSGQIGYILEGGYKLQAYDHPDLVLNPKNFNYALSSGIRYYFKEINSRSSWFFQMQVQYRNAIYSGVHSYCDQWVYSSYSFLVFGHDGWNCPNPEVNQFSARIQTFDLNFQLGWKKTLFKRIPAEFYFGFGFVNSNAEMENYKETTRRPHGVTYLFGIALEDSGSELSKESNANPQFGIKVGYLLSK